jgi:anti-anti-sigma regulatory factor
MTLRITREEGSHARATLKLEGSIVAEWAVLLERECSDLLRFSTAVSLDLAGVGFVDRAGVEALERLSRAGVEIRCPSGAVASVLSGEGVRVRHDADDVRGGQL